MTGGSATPVHVSGGVGGIVANRESIFGLANLYQAAAMQLSGAAWELEVVLGDVADLGNGAALLHVAGLGMQRPDQVATLEAITAVRSATAAVHRAGDYLSTLAHNLLVAALGYPWGSDLLDDLLGPSLWGDATAFLGGTWDYAVDVGRGGAGTGSQKYLVDHPGVVDAAVDDGEPLLAVTPLASTVLALEAYRATLEALDGHGRAIATGVDPDRTAPHSLADLARDLASRDTGPGGSIDVRIITARDGARHVVVDITGIDTAVPLPPGTDVADLTTCTRAIDGRSTAYEQGVFDAMRQAGVRPGDPVLIVGHSLGGMIAVNAARTAARTGRFSVTHVVTEGSPVGRTVGRVPPSVQVLAIENTHDVVVHLDGRANPDRRNVVTVTGAAGDDRTIAGDHDLGTVYVPLAAATDATDNASVRAFVRSAEGFLTGTSVTTHTYRVVRS